MTDDTIDGAAFNGDPDWRFPLRLGILHRRDAQTGDDQLAGVFEDATTAPLMRRIDLAVDGLDCDVVVLQAIPDLQALVGAVTLSANLVMELGHSEADVDPAIAFAASRSVGAIGYVIAEFTVEQLPLFVRRLADGATVEQALRECGPHKLVADSTAIAVRPQEAFMQSIETVRRESTPQPPTTRGGPRTSNRRGGTNRGFQPPAREDRRAIREEQAYPDLIAARVAELTIKELDRRRAGPAGVSRFLQAAFHRRMPDDNPGERVAHGFLRDEPMMVLVGIGPVGPMRLVADVGIDEAQLGEPGPGGWELDVLLKPDTGEIERRTLQLPTTGPSTDVQFPIHIDPAAHQWRGRITVLHRARAIQSAILCAPVIDTDAESDTGVRPSLTIDGEFHPMAGLDEHAGGGVVLELDTKPAVYSGSGDYLIEPRDDEMRAASNHIAAKLGDLAVDLDEARDLNDPRSRALLEYVAVQGSLLLKALFPNADQREAVTKERFLQALRLNDAAPELPYEFVYDLDSPPPDFELCGEWMDGIADYKCPRCHAEGANNRKTLCPLGFWGLSKVIERHNAVGPLESRAQARLRRGDIAGKTPVQLRRAVLALSERADEAPRGAPATYVLPSSRVKQALAAAGIPFDGPVADWDNWQEVISTKQPDLLIVLGHTKFDDDRGEWSMEIGTGSDLYLSRVFPEYVDTPPDVPGPVVLLFGCRTSSEGSKQTTFAREFRQCNASVVIGTTSTVLGRQAGPVAADLIAAVKAAEGREPVGEMLRQARAFGLANGSVMAMALNAFGDADHRLTV
jgi:hypothetical protein